MSAQNSLKKPEFKKAMWGYSVEEVDAYVAYVNERYTSVCRESAELKRRLTRFLLGMDKPEGENTELKQNIPTEKELVLLQGRLEECLRQASAVEAMLAGAAEAIKAVRAEDVQMEALSTEQETAEENSSEEAAVFDPPSAAVEPGLFFAEEAFAEEAESEETTGEAESEETTGEAECVEAYSPAFEVASEAESAEESLKHSDFKLFDGIDDGDFSFFAPIERVSAETEKSLDGTVSFEVEELDFFEGKSYAEAADASEESAPDKKTEPESSTSEFVGRMTAEELRALDFYTDESHKDGESYDPMTLAARSTAQRKKPTFADFMRPISDGNMKK